MYGFRKSMHGFAHKHAWFTPKPYILLSEILMGLTTIQLYDYQKAMYRRILYEFDYADDVFASYASKGINVRARSLMVQLPTGTGKTYLMAAVIGHFMRQLNDCPEEQQEEVWVIAHRRELVEQIEETLNGFSIGHSRGADERIEGVRVMSIQWLTLHYEDIMRKPCLIVIDEAHHSLADSYQPLWTRYPKTKKLGFTATPCRLQRKSFTGLYHKLLISCDIDEFIAKGRLSLYDYVVINKDSEDQLAIDSLSRRGTDGDYSIPEMDEKLNRPPTVARLYDSIQRYAKGKKGIVYAIDISHAQHIATYYASMGMRTVAIDSKTPTTERKQRVRDFKEGRLDCIVNVNLFDEGFDCPDVEFIQMARPTLSLAKYMQMIGRGLRVHPLKKMCVLIDNVGLYRMFGKPNAKRDWQAMFEGRKAGKGSLPKRRDRSTIIINNEMEMVANHSFSQANKERTTYLNAAEPFEHNGRWGLKVGEDIVLRPVYRMITPFVGDFATFSIAPERWGILLRNGKCFLSPDYKHIDIQPDGNALIEKNGLMTYKLHLPTVYQRWIKEMF